jgi:hypothetical protein
MFQYLYSYDLGLMHLLSEKPGAVRWHALVSRIDPPVRMYPFVLRHSKS